MMKGLILLLSVLAITCIAFSIGRTESSFTDQEQTINNTYGAWTSIQWIQTTQSDFNAGSLTNVSTTSSPGDVILTEVADCAGWYCSWNYRKMITVNHTMVADNLANFTVLINLTSDADLASYALANGNDILFTSADGMTKLDHEIENFTVSTGKLIAWVRVPSLSSSTDTSLYMYFGNPAAANQQNVPGVWDANYKGVWHLKEYPNGTPPQMRDSTSNANNGTSAGSMTFSDQVDARINGGLDFDGFNDEVTCGNNATLQITTEITIEAWAKTSINGQNMGIVNKEVIAYNGYMLYKRSVNTYRFVIGNPLTPGQNATSNIAYTDSNWHHIVGVRRSGTNYLYIDGVQQTQTFTQAITDSGANFDIGRTYSDFAGNWWNGDIDEVRVSNIGRSASWILTEYNNQYSPSTFYIVGGRESLPMVYVPSGTIASQVKDTGETGARWDALEWDEELGGGTDITFEVRASGTSFLKDNTTLSWISLGGTSPVYAGLPTGRYFQWRATLTTPDTSQSPVLNEVRAYYT